MHKCPFCGRIYKRAETTFVRDDPETVVFQIDIAYIECPCGATYCPERLRVNHARGD